MAIDRVKQRLEDQMRGVYKSPTPPTYGRKYYYVLGFTKLKNKKVFWGPMTDDDAYRALGELNEGEKFELTTRDPRRAVREVRDLLIKRGESPDDALKRLLHKRDIEEEGVESKEGFISKLFTGRLRPKARSPTIGIDRAKPVPKDIVKRWGGL